MKTPRSRHSHQQCRMIFYLCTMAAVAVAIGFAFKILVANIERLKDESRSLCTNVPRWYKKPSDTSDCFAGAKQLEQRLQLLADLSLALNKTNSLHWLCFGTLWGVIRGNKLLEYDRDGDICTVGVNSALLESVIRSIPGNIRFNKNYTSYHVWRDLAEVEITSYLYTSEPNDNTDDTMVIREGFSNSFVSRQCVPEAFPSRFIKTPLPYKRLNGVLFPVPRENYEIQMYIYPDDWYMVVKPVGCD